MAPVLVGSDPVRSVPCVCSLLSSLSSGLAGAGAVSSPACLLRPSARSLSGWVAVVVLPAPAARRFARFWSVRLPVVCSGVRVRPVAPFPSGLLSVSVPVVVACSCAAPVAAQELPDWFNNPEEW